MPTSRDRNGRPHRRGSPSEDKVPKAAAKNNMEQYHFRQASMAVVLSAAALGCGGHKGSYPWGASRTNTEHDLEIPAEGYIRLAFNESPWGPSPAARVAMEEMLARPYAMDSSDTDFLPGINRYPDFLNVSLTEVAAARHQLSPQYCLPTCGISELIYMCSQAFLGPQRHLVMPEITYPLPAYYARAKGCEIRLAPLDDEHRLDLSALLERIDHETGLVYLANPNNPTGSLITYEELEDFVRLATRRTARMVVLIDEAYMDYVISEPLPEAIPLIHSYPVIVGRTMSKAFGLAGLRTGYAMGRDDLVLTLNGFLSGYLGGYPGWRMFEGNINRMAVAAAEASLTPEGLSFVATVRDRNAKLRDYLSDQLVSLGLNSLPSQTSFLLVSAGSNGENLRRWLCSRNILVQAGGSFHPCYQKWIRVSIGDRSEIDAFLEALAGYDPSRSYPACFPVFYQGI